MQNKPILSAYLAVHHHKNNVAMLITNPNVRVRLLLSYVLYDMRQHIQRVSQAVRYRAIISQCHLKLAEITEQYERGLLTDDEAKRWAFLFTDKAELAHQRLMELNDAPG